MKIGELARAADAKADGVIRGIPEKVEGVSLQGRRTGSGTGHDLGHEKTGIDNESNPQRPTPAGAVQRVGVPG